MKRINKVILILILSFIISLQGITYVQAHTYCSSWIQYETEYNRCDSNDGCGFLWLKSTYTYLSDQKTTCAFDTADGMGHYLQTIYRSVWVNDGCC
jgi:hypothetical protein